jgi:lipopolysaccharide export system protein LptA
MAESPYSARIPMIPSRISIPGICILLMMAVFASAESAVKQEEMIHIASDKLIADSNKMYFEFIGNVQATYEGAVIKTDSLKIHYQKQVKKDSLSTDKDKIKEIVATGNVNIRFEEKIALADKAVYHTDTMVFTLSGKNPKVISGKNTVTGSKITLYRKDGRAVAEGSKETRVNMTIYAPKKDMQNVKKSR